MKRLALLAFAVLTVGLGAGAATANAPAGVASPSAAQAAAAGQVTVRFTVSRFVKKNGRLYAKGMTIGTFTPADGSPATTVRQPFTVVAKLYGRLARASTGSAQRICQVLDLQLGPLDLNLLGLMVHLDKVHLRITANSRGGILGSLFCSLANRPARLLRPAQVRQLTRVVRSAGLSTNGPAVSAPVSHQTVQQGICTVLDLTLGPLDLNLLGLLVHLDTVHLTIKADPAGGVLGNLLCSLAGGTPGPALRQ